MLEINQPKSFIKNIKILNSILGLILILNGINCEYRLIIRIFIDQGSFEDPIIWSLFGILLISSGIIGALSGFYLSDDKFIGLKLSILFYIVLSGTFTYMATYIFIHDLLRDLTGLHKAAQFLIFLFCSVIVVISIILLLAIYKNKDLLKECF